MIAALRAQGRRGALLRRVVPSAIRPAPRTGEQVVSRLAARMHNATEMKTPAVLHIFLLSSLLPAKLSAQSPATGGDLPNALRFQAGATKVSSRTGIWASMDVLGLTRRIGSRLRGALGGSLWIGQSTVASYPRRHRTTAGIGAIAELGVSGTPGLFAQLGLHYLHSSVPSFPMLATGSGGVPPEDLNGSIQSGFGVSASIGLTQRISPALSLAGSARAIRQYLVRTADRLWYTLQLGVQVGR